MQIIFNIFRQRPAELFFREAQRRRVGIIAWAPLASGLLSGEFTRAAAVRLDVGAIGAALDFDALGRDLRDSGRQAIRASKREPRGDEFAGVVR